MAFPGYAPRIGVMINDELDHTLLAGTDPRPCPRGSVCYYSNCRFTHASRVARLHPHFAYLVSGPVDLGLPGGVSLSGKLGPPGHISVPAGDPIVLARPSDIAEPASRSASGPQRGRRPRSPPASASPPAFDPNACPRGRSCLYTTCQFQHPPGSNFRDRPAPSGLLLVPPAPAPIPVGDLPKAASAPRYFGRHTSTGFAVPPPPPPARESEGEEEEDEAAASDHKEELSSGEEVSPGAAPFVPMPPSISHSLSSLSLCRGRPPLPTLVALPGRIAGRGRSLAIVVLPAPLFAVVLIARTSLASIPRTSFYP